MEPEVGFVERVSELSHQNVSRCYYCLRCLSGCPAAEFMEYTPAQILRLVQLGQKEALLKSGSIWMCIGCETCGTRCPNQIHAGAVIDTLRHLAIEAGVAPGEKLVYKLHEAFMTNLRYLGRLHELSMLAQYKLTSGDLLSDLDMGLDMFIKGKIHPLALPIEGMDEIKKLWEMGK